VHPSLRCGILVKIPKTQHFKLLGQKTRELFRESREQLGGDYKMKRTRQEKQNTEEIK